MQNLKFIFTFSCFVFVYRPGLSSKMSRSPASDAEAEQKDFRGVLTRHVQTKSKPKFSQELRDQKVCEGNAVTLQCKVMGECLLLCTCPCCLLSQS